MAFFNNDIFTSNIPVAEGLQYDVDFGGAANIAMEAYADQLEVVKAIHAADMAELRCKARGVTESYEFESVMEASVGEIFTKIKDNIKAFFAKVTKFFRSFYEKFFALNKSNKSFVEKYKPIVEELNDDKDFPASFTVENTYKYMNYATASKYATTVAENASKALEELSNAVNKAIEGLNKNSNAENANTSKIDQLGDAIDALASSITSKIFEGLPVNSNSNDTGSSTEALYSLYRGGADKTSVTYNYSMLISELDAIEEIDVKSMKKTENATTKDYNKILKTIDSAEKTYKALDENSNKQKAVCVSAANTLSSSVTKSKSTVLTSMSVLRTVIGEMCNRTKNATIKAIAMGRDNTKNRKAREKKSK